MGHDRWFDDLRAARADPAALAALLSGELPYDGLQHAGDAVLAARVDDAAATFADVTTELTAALRARGWDGDGILADVLEGDPATQSSKLTQLGVALDDPADALAENMGSEGFIDLHDGQVWTETIIEASRDAGLLDVEFDDQTRWLTVVGQGQAAPYRTMQRFIATIDDHDAVGRLTDAIDGKGAFRRFTSSWIATPISSPAGTDSTTTPDSATPDNGSPTRDTNPATPPEAVERARQKRPGSKPVCVKGQVSCAVRARSSSRRDRVGFRF